MDIDNSPKLRVSWSESMKRAFISGLLREAARVQCCDGRFKKASWQRILDGFIEETGITLNKQQLHNQFGDLKKKYLVFKKLALHENFSLDRSGNSVTGSPESWARYLEENPNAKEFQFKPLNYFEELDGIFSGCFANSDGGDYDDQDRVVFEHAPADCDEIATSSRKSLGSPRSLSLLPPSTGKRTRADEDVAPILLSVGEDINPKTPKTPTCTDRSRYVALFTAKHAGRFSAEDRVKIKRILLTNEEVCIQYEHTEEDEINYFFNLILKECKM